MNQRSKTLLLVVVGAVITFSLGLVLFVFFVVRQGFTRPVDNEFGDQHLKTTVALVELHKVRYGRYPERLKELRFAGGWDAIALGAVQYCAAPDGSRYFVQVQRGWMGRPDLKMSQEFWKGTGLDPTLAPCDK